jgi:hypothetical protein
MFLIPSLVFLFYHCITIGHPDYSLYLVPRKRRTLVDVVHVRGVRDYGVQF